MKIYKGKKIGISGGQAIFVVDPEFDIKYPLPHIVRHSPDGFQWGYGGSGPADAALAILSDCADKETADRFYQEFKRDFLECAGTRLRITEEEIQCWLAVKQEEDEKRSGSD